MVTTPFLGLRVWNLTTDPYDHAQLADNWARVDEHDHTPGKGKLITTAAIVDAAITSAKLASDIFVPAPNSVVPTGAVMPFAGATAPSGFLLCDGSSQLRTDYPDLFAVISTTYGSVDGTHFNLPDGKGRVLVGVGTGGEVAALGNSDGIATVANRRIKHNHTNGLSVNNHSTGVTVDISGAHSHAIAYGAAGSGGYSFSTSPDFFDQGTQTDGSHSHSLTDPGHIHTLSGTIGGTGPLDSPAYLVLNHIIKS